MVGMLLKNLDPDGNACTQSQVQYSTYKWIRQGKIYATPGGIERDNILSKNDYKKRIDVLTVSHEVPMSMEMM
jgi:hypothetical protein